MLKIRLQRTGKRGQAYFKVVVTEHTTKPQGKYLELLGSYDPHKNKVAVNGEKVKYWMSQGAQMSETVNNLLVSKSVIEGDKVQVWKPKKKKGGETPAPTQTPATTQAPAEAPIAETKTETKEEVKEEITAEEPTPAPVETPTVNQRLI